jgi:hypothetical protein
MLNSQASSVVLVSIFSVSLGISGFGIAVNFCVQSPLPTGKGVSGNGLVLTGVLGGLLLVGRRVRLMLASLGRRLYAPGARSGTSSLSSGRRPRRSGIGAAYGVTGDMRRGFRALPWKGPAVLKLERGIATERLLPLRECVALGLRDCTKLTLRDCERWLFWPEVRGRLSRDAWLGLLPARE